MREAALISSAEGIPIQHEIAGMPLTPLDKEAAARFGDDHIKVARIGGTTYLGAVATNNPSMSEEYNQARVGKKIVYEVQDLKISVFPNEISAAERLNGVEWEGDMTLVSRVYRFYSPQGLVPFMEEKTQANTWSEWKDGQVWAKMAYKRSKGTWEQGRKVLAPETSLEGVPIKVEPADLPK
jgi:hypothetical protein